MRRTSALLEREVQGGGEAALPRDELHIHPCWSYWAVAGKISIATLPNCSRPTHANRYNLSQRRQINDTDLHKPIKDYFRAQCNEWLASKLGAWLELPEAELLTRVKAVTSVAVLRNRAAEWLDAAVSRVAEAHPDGTNVISRAWERIYFGPARNPDLLAKAKAWRAKKMDAAAATAAAEVAASQERAVSNALVAAQTAGLGLAATAAAVIAAQQSVPAVATAQPELGPPTELLESVAALERRFHTDQVPKPRKAWGNKSGKQRGVSSRRSASNAARAAAAQQDDDEERASSDGEEGDGEEAANTASAKPGRKRTARPRGSAAAGAKSKGKGRPAAASAAAAAAASHASGSDEDTGSYSERCGGDSSSDTDASIAVARSNRERAVVAPVGKGRSSAAAATVAADPDSDGDPGPRSRSANEIPWLWARVRENVTEGKHAAAQKSWEKVRGKMAQVLLEYEGEQGHVTYWQSKLAKMEAAVKAGAVSINSYELK